MLDAKHEYELDMERAGRRLRAIRPPLSRRVAAPPPVSAPRPPRPQRRSGRAGPHPDEPDEVTRTLNNLADLRDRGAISPSEYEAKKAELLSRL